MRISVILPTVRPHTVMHTVRSIQGQRFTDWELVIVAQGHDAELHRLLEQAQRDEPRIKVVRLEKGNLSAARNAGIAASSADLLAFTDDDCEAMPDWLELLVEVFDQHPDVGYVGGSVVAPRSAKPWQLSTCPSANVIEAVYVPRESGYRAPAGFYAIGANFALRRSVVDRLGGFDTSMGAGTEYGSCEDTDYGLRCEQADITFLTTKKLVVHHTYGRRYGLRAFLNHHRNYARGRGALLVKLKWMNHRLADEWGASRSLVGKLKDFARSPARFLLQDVYGGFHGRRAAASYASQFELRNNVCVSKSQSDAEPIDLDAAASAPSHS